ncbi:unnamed protein product [Caenorhabditis brenneri]
MLPNIKSKKINLDTTFQSEIVQFLPCFDSNFLENITISYSKREDLSREIMEMEQWKQAKMVNFNGFKMDIMDDLLGFERVEAWCNEEIGHEDVVKIREKFLQSPSVSSLCLWLHHPLSPAIYDQFGMNYQDRVSHDYGTTRVWYYKDGSERVLCQEAGDTLLRFYYSGNIAPEKLNVL